MTSKNKKDILKIAQDYEGLLKVEVTDMADSSPIEGAKITIASLDNPEETIEELSTDANGMSPLLPLEAPPRELSENPNSTIQPYSEYNMIITAPGYEPTSISGSEIFESELSLQPVRLRPIFASSASDVINIPANTLWGDYPPKIPEAEIKPIQVSGEVVLSRVVVPEYIVVHDGVPTDSTAKNYYIPYRDYIKNVASSEIYSTWPDATLRANIIAIMSFTLNRVYTEW